MPSVDFARICRDMKDISESVHIHTSKNELTLECVGEFASCRMNIGETQNGVSFEGREEVSGHFALKYLSTFSKSFNLSNYGGAPQNFTRPFPNTTWPLSATCGTAQAQGLRGDLHLTQ